MRMRVKGLTIKFFQGIRKIRFTVYNMAGTVITTLLLDSISDSAEASIDALPKVISKIFMSNNMRKFLIWMSIGATVTIAVLYRILHRKIIKESLEDKFVKIMENNTSKNLKDSVGPGCLSWGEGKTVLICDDIIFGWSADNVLISDYDNNIYTFFSGDDLNREYGNKSKYPNKKDYTDFKDSVAFREIIRMGNNLPRVMLNGSKTNYDKKNRKLILSLARTEWSQTSYIWDLFGKNKGSELYSNSLMSEYALGISSGKSAEKYLPNSLCMHLLIETRDNKIVKSRISSNKRNDNPGTWAFTLGEQLDIEDFLEDGNFYSNFMLRWLRRVFREEYKLTDEMYADIINEDTFRVLSLNFESDRYNFALLCTVKLNVSFEVFQEKTKLYLGISETTELEAIEVGDIPSILATYKLDTCKIYHPSTYLRLLVFYIHKLGFDRAQNNIIDYLRNVKF